VLLGSGVDAAGGVFGWIVVVAVPTVVDVDTIFVVGGGCVC
jgi:hypothetical protein